MSKQLELDDVLTVKTPITIEAGKHSGTITNMIRRPPSDNNLYDYLDFTVKMLDIDDEPELKVGFPTNLSELSKLGRFLKKSGFDFNEGDEIKLSDIKEAIVDKKITFLTNNEKSDAGEFARVLRDTIEFD